MLILYLSLREGQTYNVVIIAKRIHLFPYRTQKLSSLAAMVLGGQPSGRVARSHVVCRSGGTGRRTGLKILRDLPLVPVRFRSSAPYKHRGVEQLAARRAHNPKVVSSSLTPATKEIIVENSLYQEIQAIFLTSNYTF